MSDYLPPAGSTTASLPGQITTVRMGGRGIPGANGTNGSRGSGWTQGAGNPTNTVGQIPNDQYLNDTDNSVWTFNGTTWTETGSLGGPGGSRGSGWTEGTGAPANTAGQITNDQYLDNATGNTWTYTEGGSPAWVQTGNIKGSTGAAGATGATGATGPAGTNGSNGSRGAGWTEGTGAPTNTVGQIANDQYLDNATGNTWTFNGATWAQTGNIKGPTGATGNTGATGATGATGPAGTNGSNGIRGSGWTEGTGAPTNTAGQIANDQYLDSATGNTWTFNGTTWAQTGNIKGPTGATGAAGATGATGAAGTNGTNGSNGVRGSTWTEGTGTPTNTVGQLNGDQYLDNATGNTWTFNGTSWSQTGNIKGPTGATGAAGTNGTNGIRGAGWTEGTGNPTNTAGQIVNDQYLDNATGNTWTYSGSAWAQTGNIQGPQGPTGTFNSTSFTTYFATIPTTLPTTSGILWNNGGTLLIS